MCLNSSSPESTLYHHLALYKKPRALLLIKLSSKLSYLCVWNLSRPASTLYYHLALSSHLIVLKVSHLFVQNIPNPHRPCTIRTCKSTKTGRLLFFFFFPSNCHPSFVSVRLDPFQSLLLIHPAHHHCLLLPAPVPIPLGPPYSFFPPQLDKTSKYPSPDRLAYSILLHLLLLNSTHISTTIKISKPRTTLKPPQAPFC